MFSRHVGPLVQLRTITHKYANGDMVTALDRVSLTVDRGEFVCIRGDSGAGKTTLMRVLGCLLRPSKGRYLFAGQDVSAIDQRHLARVRCTHVGFVFQEPALLKDGTAQQNVEMPAAYAGVGHAERIARVRHWLQEVGLGGRLGHKVAELSGGEQQKVCIARALVNNPQLILADEPTGSLDRRASDDVISLLARQAELGRAVVVVSHQLWEAPIAHRNVILTEGRIVDDGHKGRS